MIQQELDRIDREAADKLDREYPTESYFPSGFTQDDAWNIASSVNNFLDGRVRFLKGLVSVIGTNGSGKSTAVMKLATRNRMIPIRAGGANPIDTLSIIEFNRHYNSELVFIPAVISSLSAIARQQDIYQSAKTLSLPNKGELALTMVQTTLMESTACALEVTKHGLQAVGDRNVIPDLLACVQRNIDLQNLSLPDPLQLGLTLLIDLPIPAVEKRLNIRQAEDETPIWQVAIERACLHAWAQLNPEHVKIVNGYGNPESVYHRAINAINGLSG